MPVSIRTKLGTYHVHRDDVVSIATNPDNSEKFVIQFRNNERIRTVTTTGRTAWRLLKDVIDDVPDRRINITLTVAPPASSEPRHDDIFDDDDED